MKTQAIGFDIGGANIKAATVEGQSISKPFELWKSPEGLGDVLGEILGTLPETDLLAVTMTGELADCFRTKSEGVTSILDSVSSVAGSSKVAVWQTGAEFVDQITAREIPLLVAAANWHALATFAGRLIPRGPGLLVDIGTTTTDIIPIEDGIPVPLGMTDAERLQSGELVYSGVRRTPVCAVAHTVPFRDGYCPLAAEWFATMLDVYIILGRISEDNENLDTANGRPATLAESRDRLARALCADNTEVSESELLTIARFLADVQEKRISGPLQTVVNRLGDCQSTLISGAGSFIAKEILGKAGKTQDATLLELDEASTPEISESACAFAVAKLAVERIT